MSFDQIKNIYFFHTKTQMDC